MKVWNNFKISHMGINYDPKYSGYSLTTLIKDKKNNEVVTIISWVDSCNNGKLYSTTLCISINTNEKLVRKLKLPYYKHNAEPSYMRGKKYFDGTSKSKQIKCLSLGAGNVGKILRDVISYWKTHKFSSIDTLDFYRETGNHVNIEREYKV